jgi:hypothetical protein
MEDYQLLLSDERWQERRIKIVKRDAWQCSNCLNRSYITNYKCGVVEECTVFKQSLHAFSEHRAIKTTFSITFSSEGTRYQAYVTTFQMLNSLNIIGKNIYFDSFGGRVDSVKAIIGGHGWAFAKNLHVHHLYYQDTKQPWEYPETALTTLCWECHLKLHSEVTIDWLDAAGNVKGVLTPCPRCAGAGFLPEYNHVRNGVCFQCMGKRFINYTL